MMQRFIIFAYLLLLVFQQAASATPAIEHHKNSEIWLDTVIATVDSIAITLNDVGKKLGKESQMNPETAAGDPEVKEALDGLVQETLIRAEARKKSFSVTPQEIEDYINAVAEKNSMQRSEFEAALARESKSLADYRNQVEIEILKSKLVSSFVKGGASVSQQEIDKYLEDHKELEIEGTMVNLRQILLKHAASEPEEAKLRAKMEDILESIRNGAQFSELAKQHSEAPESSEGGLLGAVKEEDLGDEIREAIKDLEINQISKIVSTSAGLHLFQLESRITQDDDDAIDKLRETHRDQARKSIQNQKSELKAASYFTVELPKLHAIDIKL